MNINDFTKLAQALVEGRKCANFDKHLNFFDDIVFNKLKSNNLLPPKKFLLENLTPGAVQFLLENYALELKDIFIIFNFTNNQLSFYPEETKEVSLDAFSFVFPVIDKAIDHLDQEDILTLRKENGKFPHIVFERIEAIKKIGFNFSHLTTFNFKGIKAIAQEVDYSRLPTFIKSNIIFATTRFNESELKAIKDLDTTLMLKNFGLAMADKSADEDSAFIFNIIEEAIFNKVATCPVFDSLFADIFGLSSLIKDSFFNYIYRKWLYKAQKAYAVAPSIALAKLIVSASNYSYKESKEKNINIPYKDYALFYLKFETICKDFNDIEWLNENKNDAADILLESFFSEGNGSRVVNIDTNELSFVNLLQNYKEVLMSEPTHYKQNIYTALKLVFNKDFLFTALDKANNELLSKSARFIPSLNIDQKKQKPSGDNFEMEKHFLSILIEWQKLNPESDLIAWGNLYQEMYKLDSSCLNALEQETMRDFAVICVKNILTSANGDLFNIDFQSYKEPEADNSVKWLVYSPESCLLAPLFKENTNNGSILFAKLAFREGLKPIQENELYQRVLLKLAYNHRSYRGTLSTLFPEIDFSSMSMGSMMCESPKDNFFKANLFNECDKFQIEISRLPISYDVVEEFCEDAQDEDLINYLYVAHSQYIPETFLEEFYSRKLYVDSFAIFFNVADKIMSWKIVDDWKKKVFKEASVNECNLDFWDCLFEISYLDELIEKEGNNGSWSDIVERKKENILHRFGLLAKNEKINPNTLWEKRKSFSFSVDSLTEELFTQEKFKRTIGFLKSPWIASFVYIYANPFDIKSVDSLKEKIEKNHISVNENFLNAMIEAAKRTQGNLFAVDAASSLLFYVFDVFPRDVAIKALGKVMYTFPEIIYNDTFINCLTKKEKNLFEAMSLEEFLYFTESAINNGMLLADEFVCSDDFKERFQKTVYLSSVDNVELFRKYPVGYALLNLLSPLTNQNAISNGWSLSISTSLSHSFLTGLKAITNRMVWLCSKQNFVLFEALAKALKNGGSSLALIKKDYLSFLRDNHLYLYLYFLDRLGADDDTIYELEQKFSRAFLEQKMTLFEEFALSVTRDTKTGKKKSIIPLEEIYKDNNITDSYSVVYHIIDKQGRAFNDVEFLVNRLKNFVAQYPTVYRDMAVVSSYPYCKNIQQNKSFFVAISDDVLMSILNKHRYELNMEKVMIENGNTIIEDDSLNDFTKI